MISTGPLLARSDSTAAAARAADRAAGCAVSSAGQALPVGARLPSTRALAADLGVSRGVVVGAYAQLAAEGYLDASPRRGSDGRSRRARGGRRARRSRHPDRCARSACDLTFRTSRSSRGTQWLGAVSRVAPTEPASADFSYGEPFGAGELRLAARAVPRPDARRRRSSGADGSLRGRDAGAGHARDRAPDARARGASPSRIPVTAGARGRFVGRGSRSCPSAWTAKASCVDAFPDVPRSCVSPDHQFPLGVALSAGAPAGAGRAGPRSGDRLVARARLRRRTSATTSLPAGALQALAPEHVAYVGSASALLAPAIRIGWAVLPARLVEPVAHELFASAIGTPRLTQLALADFDRARPSRSPSAPDDRRVQEAPRGADRGARDAAPRRGAARAGRRPLRLGRSSGRCRRDASWSGPLAARASRSTASASTRPRPPAPGLVLGFAAAPEPTLRRAVTSLPS